MREVGQSNGPNKWLLAGQFEVLAYGACFVLRFRAGNSTVSSKDFEHSLCTSFFSKDLATGWGLVVAPDRADRGTAENVRPFRVAKALAQMQIIT